MASHLGSGAEIFGLFLEAGLAGGKSPGADAFGSIWDRWNAKEPAEQVSDSVEANEGFVAQIEQLEAGDRESFSVDLFGSRADLSALAGARLGEHALHTWDVAVALDPSATVSPDAVDLLIDTMPQTAARAGRAAAEARTLTVQTTAPSRLFTLTTGPDVILAPAGDQGAPPDLRPVFPGV